MRITDKQFRDTEVIEDEKAMKQNKINQDHSSQMGLFWEWGMGREKSRRRAKQKQQRGGE
jgi:hypothetical protein